MTSFYGLLFFGTQNASAAGWGFDTGVDSYYHLGNLYVVGSTSSYSAGGSDIMIMKVDPADGSIVWFRTYGYIYPNGPNAGSSGDDYGRAIRVNGDYIYITGTIMSARGDLDIIILKYELDGDRVINENYPVIYNSPNNGDDFATGIWSDATNVFIGGYSNGFTVNLNDNDVLGMRYHKDGTFGVGDWVKNYDIDSYEIGHVQGINSNDLIHSMIVTSNDGIIMVGSTDAGADLGTGRTDFLLVKLDRTDGSMVTNQNFPKHNDFGQGTSSVAYSVAFDIWNANPDAFYFTGSSNTQFQGGREAWIARWDINNVWGIATNYFGPQGAVDTEGSDITVNYGGTFIYVTGYYSDPAPQGGALEYYPFIMRRTGDGGMGAGSWVIDQGYGSGPGAKYDYGTSVVTDLAGIDQENVYVLSSVNSQSYALPDMEMRKYSYDGQSQWNPNLLFGESLEDKGNAIDCDANNFIYIAGSTNSYSSNPDRTYQYPPDTNIFVAKHRPNGNGHVWFSTWDGGLDDCAYAVHYYDGYVYVTGYSMIANGGNCERIVVLKFDATTGKLMQPPSPVFHDTSPAPACARAMDIYCTGSQAYIYITGYEFRQNTKDVIVLCYDLSLNLQQNWPVYWSRNNDNAEDVAYAIVIGQDAQAIPYAFIAGETDYNFVLPPANGGFDAFIELLRLDTRCWAWDVAGQQFPKLIGTASDDRACGLSLRTNADGTINSVYMTGYVVSNGHHVPFLAKCPLWAMMQWVITTGSEADDDEVGLSVAYIVNTNTIMVCGIRNSNQGLVIMYQDLQNNHYRDCDHAWGSALQPTGAMGIVNNGACYDVIGYTYTTIYDYGGSYDVQLIDFPVQNTIVVNWQNYYG